MSAKERIEQTPRIRELEMQWLRGKPEEFFPWAKKRSRSSVGGRHFLPHLRFRSRIHTHICTEGTPSLPDLSIILSDIKWSNIRNWHIVSLDATGNVEGYFSMRPTRKMVEALINRTEEARNLFDETRRYLFDPKGKTAQAEAELLKRFKRLGLSIKSIAMKGYVFNGQRFVKK